MYNIDKSKLTMLLVAVLVMILGATYMNGTLANNPAYERDATDNGALLDEDGNYKISIVTNDNIPIMNQENLFSNVFWCPGRTEIIDFVVTNNEIFPLKCELSIKASPTSNKLNETLTLHNAFSYAVIEKDKDYVKPLNWNQFFAQASERNKGALRTEKSPIFRIESFSPNATKQYALAIHMNENASSEYMQQEMAISFDLYTEANSKPGPASN